MPRPLGSKNRLVRSDRKQKASDLKYNMVMGIRFTAKQKKLLAQLVKEGKIPKRYLNTLAGKQQITMRVKRVMGNALKPINMNKITPQGTFSSKQSTKGKSKVKTFKSERPT